MTICPRSFCYRSLADAGDRLPRWSAASSSSFRTSHEDRLNPGSGPSASGLRQNKMMQMRILFQGVAILLVILLLMAAGSHGS